MGEVILFTIKTSKSAIEDFEKIKKSGLPSVRKKLARILEELEKDPTKGIGSPEQLKGTEGIVYSRELTKKDRIVYEIYEEEKTIVISQFLGHYSDK